jgi:hypothetical protein
MSSGGPVGEGPHVVVQGECVASLAIVSGHFWETLWNLPENATLQEARKDPNILLPGDRLTIPPLRPKIVACGSGRKHVFRRRGVPVLLNIRFSIAGEPRANDPYVLRVDGQEFRGTLDADGGLSVALPRGGRRGAVTVGEGDMAWETAFSIGALDPEQEPSGIQGRLRNLGFDAGEDAADGERLAHALRLFQRQQDLTESGEADEATLARLREVAGR